jgi:hypothetical protein
MEALQIINAYLVMPAIVGFLLLMCVAEVKRCELEASRAGEGETVGAGEGAAGPDESAAPAQKFVTAPLKREGNS